MLLLGLLWCALFSLAGQGDTPWEPNDKGWFTAWIVQYIVIGALLVLLWSKRVHRLLMVVTPIAIQALPLFLPLGPSTNPDASDTSTFTDGFMEVFPYTIVGTAAIAAVIGAGFFVQGRRNRTPTRPG